MQLPLQESISISRLSQVFNNTSATYKFYWFISILEIYAKKQESRITFNEILTRMIANAWYPIHYFRLSFGLQDLLSENTKEIQCITDIAIDLDKDQLQALLMSNTDRRVRSLINNFSLQVPYRFLTPWIKYISDRDMMEKSHEFKNDCLYSIQGDKAIVLNEKWCEYLFKNNSILLDFCYWNLTMYLQTKNPNVPDLANKLIKPILRNTLTLQRAYWEIVFDSELEIECIYTGKKLRKENYDLEHFIPWSFVAHDLQWNLLPSDKVINCSKGNKLPSLDLYFSKFVKTQKTALEIVFRGHPHNKKLEDFSIFGLPASDLAQMSLYDFNQLYYKMLSPMLQTAENMGFERWE